MSPRLSHRFAHIFTWYDRLRSAGFPDVVNSDLSAEAVAKARRIFAADSRKLIFVQDDALKSQFDDASFDIILDKGCLDAICFFTEPKAKNVAVFLAEVTRLLRPGGKYLYITSSSHGESCLPLFMTALGQFEGVLEPLEEGLEIAEAHVCAQFPEKVLMHVVGRCGGA